MQYRAERMPDGKFYTVYHPDTGEAVATLYVDDWMVFEMMYQTALRTHGETQANATMFSYLLGHTHRGMHADKYLAMFRESVERRVQIADATELGIPDNDGVVQAEAKYVGENVVRADSVCSCVNAVVRKKFEGVTDNPSDPAIKEITPSGMQAKYLVLSEAERAKGFVRPVRRSYRHVGIRPKHPVRDLTPEEHERYNQFAYVRYEAYPEGSDEWRGGTVGRFWTQAQLSSGCQGVTTMGQALAETYARRPDFYGGTFCATCGTHLPVGADGEFVWVDDGSRVGT